MTNVENTNPTRPVRTRQPNPKYHDFYQFLLSEEQKLKDITIQEYDYHESELIANILTNLENNVKHQQNCYTQTFGLKQGIKRFEAKCKAAAEKEILQLHNRKVSTPILPYEITTKRGHVPMGACRDLILKETRLLALLYLQKHL